MLRSARIAAPVMGMLAALAPLLLAACTASSTAAVGGSNATLSVIAAENVWGSIASQVGGARVTVTSILTDPNADPHEYESSTAAARLFADADYVVLNGAGYDDWGRKLLDANPSSRRTVLSIADLLGTPRGGNPHVWYSPTAVEHVAARIAGDLSHIDPAGAGSYAAGHAAFSHSLARYHSLITGIRSRFGGVAVGSTESIVEYMARALGLDLASPAAFMQAVAEGNDPPAASVAQFQHQLDTHAIAVLVYNTQTVTEVTTAVRHQAEAQHIPVVGVSETIQPPTATFQQWQVAQLTALQAALASATGT